MKDYSISTTGTYSTDEEIQQKLDKIVENAKQWDKVSRTTHYIYLLIAFGISIFGIYLFTTIGNAIFPFFRGILSAFITISPWVKFNSHTQLKRGGELLYLTIDLAKKHHEILHAKRIKMIKIDGYGKVKGDRWAKEIDYFINNVVYPEAEKLEYDLHRNLAQYLNDVYNAVDLVISLDSLKKESQGSTISELSTTQASLDNNNSSDINIEKELLASEYPSINEILSIASKLSDSIIENDPYLTFELTFFLYFLVNRKSIALLDNQQSTCIESFFKDRFLDKKNNLKLDQIKCCSKNRFEAYKDFERRTESKEPFFEISAKYINTLLTVSIEGKEYFSGELENIPESTKSKIIENKYTELIYSVLPESEID